MVKLLKRKKVTEKEIMDEIENEDLPSGLIPIETSLVVSTGCTLLDLAILGGRVRGGGLPGGIMVELHGPSGCGKTALAVDIAASIQNKGGEADIADPESRLDKEYARIYGAEINKDNYWRPKTVTEIMDDFINWEVKNKKVLNVKICDSIAALCSELEMQEGGDKRGQAKAKELHAGCRKLATEIAKDYKAIIFTNHEMDGDYGKTTPGGKAVPYYASLRIRINQIKLVEETKKISSGKSIKKSIGVLSNCFVKKSSVDNAYRSAPLYMINGHGIDDVRGNLQWYKDMMKGTKYIAVDKEYKSMADAIRYIEKEDLEIDLREMVIDLWDEIEDKFRMKRKKKVRF